MGKNTRSWMVIKRMRVPNFHRVFIIKRKRLNSQERKYLFGEGTNRGEILNDQTQGLKKKTEITILAKEKDF